MATFLTDLFQSIFTAGPTPTLLVATNVSFAALQLVLLLLLIATYSIHFLILSFLSGGLWWAINWFVAELKLAQEVEREKKRREAERAREEEDTETEVETVVEKAIEEKIEGAEDNAGGGRSEEVEIFERKGALREREREQRERELNIPPVSKSETSTEDEWERVSENENEKDK